MSQSTERRPFLAALLTVVQPGVGHCYLREWLRGCLWAGVWAGALVVLVDSAGVELGVLEWVAVGFGVFPAAAGFPFEATLSMFAVTAFATLDAYWLAARNNHRLQDDIGRCPHCGREMDPTLEFCHWCTEPRDGEGSA